MLWHKIQGAAGLIGAGGAADLVNVEGSAYVNSISASSHTFSSVDIGTASTNREVVVCGYNDRGASPRTLDAITIGGVSATIHVIAEAGQTGVTGDSWICSAIVSSGATADIALTFSGVVSNIAIQVYSINRDNSTIDAIEVEIDEPSTAQSSFSVTTTTACDYAFIAHGHQDETTTVSSAPSGFTEDYVGDGISPPTGSNWWFGHIEPSTATTYTLTNTASETRSSMAYAGFSKYGPITFVGAVTYSSSERYFGTAGGTGWSNNPDYVDIESIAQPGDLVVLAVSCDNGTDSDWTWGTGATFTRIGTASSAVRNQTLYRFWQAGDTNPAPDNDSGYNGLSVVAAVFRNVSSYLNFAEAFNISGMPNPPSLAQSGAKLWVAVGHLDDDAITMTAQAGYTMAGADSGTSTGTSSTGISYLISSVSFSDPAPFGGGGDDSWVARTIAFDRLRP